MENNSLERVLDYEKFFIPNYQRDYAWKVENFNDLWGDLEESLALAKESPQDKGHYLGTIVLAQHNQNEKEVDVIDGQQRITTIFMILLALWERLDDKHQGRKGTDLLYDEAGKLKLQVSENNRAFLEEILKSAGKNNLPSAEQLGLEIDTQGKENLYKVFDAILGKVNAFDEEKAREYFDNLLKMEIIVFKKNSIGASMRTFQSVNDRGVPLALLIYYSNQYCEGEKGLDSEINECFSEIFRISNKIVKHQYCSSVFGKLDEKNIEADIFRYHMGSNKKFRTFGGGEYKDSSETTYDNFKSKLKEINKDDLKSFLRDYVEDLKAFFQAMLDILDSVNKNLAMFKCILLENLNPMLYNTFVRLQMSGELKNKDENGMIKLFAQADFILFKCRKAKGTAYSLIKTYEDKGLEALKNEIHQLCRKEEIDLESVIKSFIRDYSKYKSSFHYIFIEQNCKGIDIETLKNSWKRVEL